MKGSVRLFYTISLLALLIAIVIGTDAIKEGFAATSPGTMLQLRTSHVRTQEDEEDEKNLLGLINRDLIHMTGSGLF
jgi:hypothetical protein